MSGSCWSSSQPLSYSAGSTGTANMCIYIYIYIYIAIHKHKYIKNVYGYIHIHKFNREFKRFSFRLDYFQPIEFQIRSTDHGYL